MRAGIHRLSAIVTAEFESDPMDGSLYVFVSRDACKIKMLHFDVSGWCLYYCTLAQGVFRWIHEPGGCMLEIERRQLFWLLDGLEIMPEHAPKPITARVLL